MSRRHGNSNHPTVTLHVVTSLDGFIARPDNTVSWLENHEPFEGGVPDDAAMDAVKAIDCYVLGSRTYEHALELGWPYGDTPTVVLTHRELPARTASVEFHSGDLTRLIDETLAPRFKNIWVVGGAQVSQNFLELGLVDDIRLTIAPVLLGEGLLLFGPLSKEARWRVKDVVAYKSGFVGLWYQAL